jgi:hypothetical protein
LFLNVWKSKQKLCLEHVRLVDEGLGEYQVNLLRAARDLAIRFRNGPRSFLNQQGAEEQYVCEHGYGNR